jgi:hypothetical protein
VIPGGNVPAAPLRLARNHTSSNGGPLGSVVHGPIVSRVAKRFAGRAPITLSSLLSVDMTINQWALPSNVAFLDI